MRQELATARRVGDDHDVKREKLVMVRLTESEHKAWSEAAEAARRTLADWVRVTVADHLETVHVLPSRAKQHRSRASAKQYVEAIKKGGR